MPPLRYLPGLLSLSVLRRPGSLYLARRGPPQTVAELADHVWITHQGLRLPHLDGTGGTARVVLKERITCDDMSFLYAAIKAGTGIGALPTFLAERDVRVGDLVRVLPQLRISSGLLWLTWGSPPTWIPGGSGPLAAESDPGTGPGGEDHSDGAGR